MIDNVFTLIFSKKIVMSDFLKKIKTAFEKKEEQSPEEKKRIKRILLISIIFWAIVSFFLTRYLVHFFK